MFRTERNQHDLLLVVLFSILSFGYLAVAFPRAYFRHDDWLMIGNVVRIIPQDWKFIFEPYLIFNSIKDVWFFRPWFKLILYLKFMTLGYRYDAWLAMNLIFTIGALSLGYLTIRRLTLDAKRGLICVAFFIASIHFHFGSLVWVGEGTMNCPQLLCLFLNFYLFSIGLTESKLSFKIVAHLLAILFFIISLGFKESSIFHLPFLLVLFFHQKPIKISPKLLTVFFTVFSPYVLIGSFYLFFRLYLLPFNEGYKPKTNLLLILKPSLFLLFTIALPSLTLLVGSLWYRVKREDIPTLLFFVFKYLVFFIPFFISYVGHGFFSPGWLTAPGIYLAFLLGLKLPSIFIHRQILLASIVLTVIISSGLVFFQTHSIKWWSWYKPQRQIVEIIEKTGTSQTQWVRIFNCESTEDRLTPLIRVVGYDASIREVFWLKHKNLPRVDIFPCSTMEKILSDSKINTLNLKWTFPGFQIVDRKI